MKNLHLPILLWLSLCGIICTADERPNVVLFLVDDMGWMDSSAYGSQYYETPNMERFKSQAMYFSDAYATPLCSPTRASILTGQYSSRHGITTAQGHMPAQPIDASRYPAKAPANKPLIYANSKRYLDPSLDTLAKVLQRGGYRTGHFGKWHLGLAPEHWPDKHGFDVAFHAEPSPGPASYFSPYGVHESGKPSGKHHVGNIPDGPDGEYITDRLTDEALAFVEANQDRPFFLNLWHYAVHGPWGHKESYTQEFASKEDPRGMQGNPIMASMLKSVDESLGRVLDRLDELDLTSKTLFIFYSDNGGNTHSNIPGARGMDVPPGHPKWSFVQDWRKWAGTQAPTNNAPLREGKGRIYEGGQRVPLMIRWPGQVAPGTQTSAVVGPIDLYPTILQAAGLVAQRDHVVDGESIMPVLQGTGKLQRSAYFTWFPHLTAAASVRQGAWKLIRRFEPRPAQPETIELYDLNNDLGETRNLADSNPERVLTMEALIDEFITETGALEPRKNPDFQPNETRDSGKSESRMKTRTKETSKTKGLVARSCSLELASGALVVKGNGKQPFLGTAQVRMSGPLDFSISIKPKTAGEVAVHWKTRGQDQFSERQVVTFSVTPGTDASAWKAYSVALPIRGQPQIIRIYLPTQQTPVELQSLQFSNSSGETKSWSFK